MQLVALGITVQGVPAVFPDASYAVTVYEVIALPPVDTSGTGVSETVAVVFPRTALSPVGAAGIPAGVTDVEFVAPEVPVEFVAVALNV